jgi:hypothetical protein
VQCRAIWRSFLRPSVQQQRDRTCRTTREAGGVRPRDIGHSRLDPNGQGAIEAVGLTRRFVDFVAVDHVSFNIGRGEIFWLPRLERLRKNNDHEDAHRAPAAGAVHT